MNAVDQVLRGRRFRRAALTAGKGGHLKALELWLVDVAAGEMGPQSLAEKAVRHFRTNASAALMGFKVATAMIQPTGFAQSIPVLGEKWMAVGMKRMAELGIKAGAYVNDASPGMRLRGQGHVEQVAAVNRSLSGKGVHLPKHAWWMMARTQRIVDVATFLGAEVKGMELFDNDQVKARAYAFDVVERAQGSNDFVGKNALQRGTAGQERPPVRVGEGLHVHARLHDGEGPDRLPARRAHRLRKPAEVIRLTADVLHLFVWEVMAITLLRGGWPDDDDEDGDPRRRLRAVARQAGRRLRARHGAGPGVPGHRPEGLHAQHHGAVGGEGLRQRGRACRRGRRRGRCGRREGAIDRRRRRVRLPVGAN